MGSLGKGGSHSRQSCDLWISLKRLADDDNEVVKAKEPREAEVKEVPREAAKEQAPNEAAGGVSRLATPGSSPDKTAADASPELAVPKIVHQQWKCNRADCLPDGMRQWHATCKRLNPEFEVTVHSRGPAATGNDPFWHGHSLHNPTTP